MGWLSIFDIINKLLPGREERIRDQIDEIKSEIEDLRHQPWDVSTAAKYTRLIDKLSILEKALENR
jgi:hypothetical protein